MNILIACEYSGVIRDAFHHKGHNAWSCDFHPTEIPGQHYQGDIRNILNRQWDMLIAHPDCTHLASSGARWFKNKKEEQKNAIDFFMMFVNAKIPKIAIENPVGIMSTVYRKPDQYINPWEYGHGETKKTCLWLKGLPKLVPTNIVEGREARIHRMPPSPERSKERSRTYQGWADAMADQWG